MCYTGGRCNGCSREDDTVYEIRNSGDEFYRIWAVVAGFGGGMCYTGGRWNECATARGANVRDCRLQMNTQYEIGNRGMSFIGFGQLLRDLGAGCVILVAGATGVREAGERLKSLLRDI